MRKSKIKVLIIVFGFLFFNCFSQTTVLLSYDAYLKNVLENNPISKRADNIKQYGELQYKASKGNFDPFVSGTYENKNFNGSNYYSILNSGVKVPLFTAQNLKVGYEYGVGQNINPEQYTSSYGLPYVGLEVGLLQGMFIDYRRRKPGRRKVSSCHSYSSHPSHSSSYRCLCILFHQDLMLLPSTYFLFLHW